MSSDANFSEERIKEVYRNEGTSNPVTEELCINLSEKFGSADAKTFRYVRVIRLLPGEQMTISEVTVLGRKIAGDGKNIAKGKTVTASSNHAWYPPSAAVDGLCIPEGTDGSRWVMDASDKNKPWIMVDLGGEYRINSLVFQMMGVSDVSYMNFQIELSMDESFEKSKVVYQQGNQKLEGRGSVLLDENESICRYIRIQSLTEIGGSDYQLFGVVEIAAYSTDLPYIPTDSVEFLTSAADETPVDTVPESGMFAVRFKGENTGATAKKVTLIQAGYTDNALRSVKLYPMTIPAGVSALPMLQSVLVEDSSETYFKFFVWEESTLKPLYEPGAINRQ